MKINNLIKDLQKIKNKLGNIEVQIQYPVRIHGLTGWETSSADKLITEVHGDKDVAVLIYKGNMY